MIEFRCLGGTDLRRADGDPLPALLSGSKRLALLSYLALARPRGFQRRDILLALFWPESDQGRARTSLRNMLHQIRSELGGGVVVNRGNEEIGIAEGALWCDAVAFEEHLEAGRLTEALDLYRGELLEGLHVPDAAPGFERWLEGERERLRRMATRAAAELRERAEEAGELELAIRWARRTAALSPWDEAAARALIGSLDRSGKRADALHVYETLAERLRTDLEMEPSAETEALAREIRERDRPTTPQLSPPAPVDLPQPTPLQERTREDATPTAPVRAKVLAGGLALCLVALAAFLAATGSERSRPAPGPSSLTRIAILPFAYHGSPEYAYLGGGMVDLLSAALDGVGDLRSVDPHALTSVLGQENGAGIAPDEGRRVAEHLGAEQYVVGSITETGGQLQFRAALHDPRGDRLAMVTAAAPAEGDMLAAVDALARQLLAEEFARTGDRMTHLAARTTSSLPALKAYLRGAQLLRSGEGAAAGEAFERALQADSSFALAYHGLAVAGGWGHGGSSVAALERALRWADRLPRRERTLLEAFHASKLGRVQEAERLYGTILAEAPDHVAAWFGLGEVLFHQAALTGRTPSAAREAFERVLSFVPDHVFSLYHLSNVLAAERRVEELAPVTERILQTDAPTYLKLSAQAQLAFVANDRRVQGRALAGLDSIGHAMIIVMTSLFVAHAGELEGAAKLADLVAGNRSYPAHARLLLWRMSAEHELGRGRWDAAQRRLEEAGRLDAAQALAARAYLATTPFLPVPEDELRLLRHRLREISDPDAALQEGGLPGTYVRHYLLGLISARLGDGQGALGHADALAALPEVPAAGSLPRDFAATVRAYHYTRQHPERALAELEAMELQVPQDAFLLSQTGSLSHARLLRPELLRTLGREEEALRWYAAAMHSSVGVPMNVAAAHRGMALICDAREEEDSAVEHYRRAAKLWEDADPSLRSRMGPAKRRPADPAGGAR